MFVFDECLKAVQNSDSPSMVAALAIVLVVCIAGAIWAIIRSDK